MVLGFSLLEDAQVAASIFTLPQNPAQEYQVSVTVEYHLHQIIPMKKGLGAKFRLLYLKCFHYPPRGQRGRWKERVPRNRARQKKTCQEHKELLKQKNPTQEVWSQPSYTKPCDSEDLFKGNEVILKLKSKWKPTSKKMKMERHKPGQGGTYKLQECKTKPRHFQKQHVKRTCSTNLKHFKYLRKWKAEVESLTQYTTKI